MRRTKANQAKSAFKTVVQTIEKLELEHTVNADMLEVFFTVRDMRLRMVVDPVRCLVRLRTPITNLPEDKRPGGAIIVTAINYSLIAGKFDYDVRDGEVCYEHSIYYRDGILSIAMIEYLIDIVSDSTDCYDDHIRAYGDGTESMEDVLEFVYS